MSQPESDKQFSVGSRVEHSQFGPGTIKVMTDSSATVRFDDGKHASIVFAHLEATDTPDPADTVDPELRARMDHLAKRYGGQVHFVSEEMGLRIYNATVNGEKVVIGIDETGDAFSYTMKGGRKPLDEPPELIPVSPADWHGKPVPPRQWYVPGLVPMRQVTLLYGDGGVGKSLLALQIAAAGALATETVGLVPRTGRVLYLGAEDEADEFHRRLADIVRAHNKTLAELGDFRLLPMAEMDATLSAPDRAGTMRPTALWSDVVDIANDWRPRLIVLDTVADLFAGDEIKRGQARQFIAMLRKEAIRLGCAIILLAHPSVQGMSSGTGTSGSTGWSNSARSRLYLTADKDDQDVRLLKTMKANYGSVGDEIRLRWQDGAFVLDDGKPTAGAKLMEKRAKDEFLRMLAETNRVGGKVGPSTGGTYAPNIFAKRKDAGGISKAAFATAMTEMLADGTIAIITEGRKGRETKRLVVTADEIAQGRAEALPAHLSDAPVRRVSDGCQTVSDGVGGTPPITPYASDTASDTPDGGHAGLTLKADNDDFDPSKLTFLKSTG